MNLTLEQLSSLVGGIGCGMACAGFVAALLFEERGDRSRLVRVAYVVSVAVCCLGMAGCIGGCCVHSDAVKAQKGKV